MSKQELSPGNSDQFSQNMLSQVARDAETRIADVDSQKISKGVQGWVESHREFFHNGGIIAVSATEGLINVDFLPLTSDEVGDLTLGSYDTELSPTDWDKTMQFREGLAVRTFASNYPSGSIDEPRPLRISDLAVRDRTGVKPVTMMFPHVSPRAEAHVITRQMIKYTTTIPVVDQETQKQLKREGLYPHVVVKPSSEPGSYDITPIISAMKASLQQEIPTEAEYSSLFWRMISKYALLQAK